MMYWLGLVLFAYSIVAVYILGNVMFNRHTVTNFDGYSDGEVIAMTIFCSFFWPIALYQGRITIRFR